MRRIKTILLLGITGIYLLVLANTIVKLQVKNQLYTTLDHVPFREVGLVLGANKKGRNGLNPYFKYRMEAAAALYLNGKVNRIIVSGDNHIKSYNETDDMRDYLVTLGVPKSAITCDYAGFRTLDSVVRAKKVFGCHSLTIISQAFHNQRAVYIANQNGLDAVGFNAKDVGSRKNLTHIREVFAKLLVVLDVHLFNRKPRFL